MDRFQNKYRIPSSRLQTWDYSSNGAYFITICTLNREPFFGDIANGEMRLNEIGKIAEQQWIKTPELRPDMNLELDIFVVMPNHFHGIIIIGENQYNTIRDTIRRDAMHCVSTATDITTDTTTDTTTGTTTDITTDTTINTTTIIPNIHDKITNQFGPQSKNLASVIRGFKSSVTTQAKKSGNNDFAWQSRFHEHIIRNSAELYRIRNYIINNPAIGDKEKFND
jgi:REP element-mobilizing transposase RayT